MALTSVPLTPRVRWWTKLARFPRLLWSTSHGVTVMLTDHSQRQPSKQKFALIRLVVLTGLVLFSPVALVLRSRSRSATAFEALNARVREIWPTSAHRGGRSPEIDVRGARCSGFARHRSEGWRSRPSENSSRGTSSRFNGSSTTARLPWVTLRKHWPSCQLCLDEPTWPSSSRSTVWSRLGSGQTQSRCSSAT